MASLHDFIISLKGSVTGLLFPLFSLPVAFQFVSFNVSFAQAVQPFKPELTEKYFFFFFLKA